jgi:predicted dehydrogenase
MVHDHVWGEIGHWKSLPNVELVAAADINGPLRDKAVADAGVAHIYESWREMLDREHLDIVQAAAENNAGAEIVEECAKRGIHVISEKPMAATLAQADRMLKASVDGKIKLLINWPTAWSPVFQEWKNQIEAGQIGRITYIKYRSAHNGPKEIGCSPYFWGWLYDAEKNGAGALMDYCCYAADMAALLLGLPKSVTGIRGTLVKDYPIPDDNAIILMKYPGAFGVAEASWTQTVPYAEGANPVAYGTEGSVAVSAGKVVVQRPQTDPLTITPAELVFPHRSGPEYLIYCIENDLPVAGFCSPKVSRDAQAILEAGLQSADTGRTIDIDV